MADNPRAFWLRKYAALILLGIAAVILLICYYSSLGSLLHFRAVLAFMLAAAALSYIHTELFPKRTVDPNHPNAPPTGHVKFFIAFNAATFSIFGIAIVVSAVDRWELGVLLAGACLLIGGFLGLLFGYPQGAAAQPPKSDSISEGQAIAKDVDSASPAAAPTNLVAESALTLGKVLTGFTLAKLGTLGHSFWDLCGLIAPALGSDRPQVLCGAILIYFLATGFLSGLLLPSYFMSGKWG